MVSVTELNAGNSSRASHVWRMDDGQRSEIYRRSWWSAPEVSAFMLGLGQLFGVDPRDLHATESAYGFWRELGVWTVPQTYGLTEFRDAPALRVEFVPGDQANKTFAEADTRLLGRQIAQVHQQAADFFGDVSGQRRQPLEQFYVRALETIRATAPRYAPQNWAGHWDMVERIFAAAPPPRQAAPMLLDWNESQFVWRGGQPFALVDVEASVLAPPELDLTFWELLLTTGAPAQAFQAGDRDVRPFPDLSAHRAACRLILLALESEGTRDAAQWLAQPAVFETG